MRGKGDGKLRNSIKLPPKSFVSDVDIERYLACDEIAFISNQRLVTDYIDEMGMFGFACVISNNMSSS